MALGNKLERRGEGPEEECGHVSMCAVGVLAEKTSSSTVWGYDLGGRHLNFKGMELQPWGGGGGSKGGEGGREWSRKNAC